MPFERESKNNEARKAANKALHMTKNRDAVFVR